MGRMLQNLDKAQARTRYKIQGNAPEAESLPQGRATETRAKKNMALKVVNPVTAGDRTSRRSNSYDSGRIDKSRS